MLFPFLLIALAASLLCLFVPRLRTYLSYAVLLPLVYGTTYLPLAMLLLRFDWLRLHLSRPGNGGDYTGSDLTWLGFAFVLACGLPGVAVVVLFLRWLRRDRRRPPAAG
jgi:hypothetical protein